MKPLAGRVAVVAGAARGAGRGTARMLGEAGATVYCTGRSSSGVRRSGPYASRPETIEQTAAQVDEAGGRGIAVAVDHAVESEVESLFVRVRTEQGRLDVLVNVLGGPASEWKPFWEQPLALARANLEGWLWTHLLTSRCAAPLMMDTGSGLVVEVTEGETIGYRGNLYYDIARTGAVRLAYGLAEELKPHGITALSLTPGFMRTEVVLEHFGVSAAKWRDAVDTPAGRRFLLSASETPCFIGRAVVALATDAQVQRKSGGLYSAWALAAEYGFTDVTGERPDWGAAFAEHSRKNSYGGHATSVRWELVDATQTGDVRA